MRKTLHKVANAWIKGRKAKSGNYATDGRVITLFGNDIARREANGDVLVSLGGWDSRTSASAMSGILFFLYMSPLRRRSTTAANVSLSGGIPTIGYCDDSGRTYPRRTIGSCEWVNSGFYF